MFLLKVPHCMEVTYVRATVPNSFSRRMKLLCNTLTEHDKLKEGKKNALEYDSSIACI